MKHWVFCVCLNIIRNWRSNPLNTALRRPTPPRLLIGRRTWRRTDIRTLFHVSKVPSFATIIDVGAHCESPTLLVSTWPLSPFLSMVKKVHWLCFFNSWPQQSETLIKHLKKWHGLHQCQFHPGMWSYITIATQLLFFFF